MTQIYHYNRFADDIESYLKPYERQLEGLGFSFESKSVGRMGAAICFQNNMVRIILIKDRGYFHLDVAPIANRDHSIPSTELAAISAMETPHSTALNSGIATGAEANDPLSDFFILYDWISDGISMGSWTSWRRKASEIQRKRAKLRYSPPHR